MNINYLDWANEQFKSRNYQAALKNYNLAIQQYPSLPEAYINRGLVKRILGNHQEAIQDFTIATILNPKMDLAFYYRGLAYYEIGEYPDALANYNHAIYLYPNLSRAYYQRAIIYGELGNSDRAMKDFKKAGSLAKKQGSTELYHRAKQAQNEVRKLSKSSSSKMFNRFIKFALLFSLLGLTINKFAHNSSLSDIKEIKINPDRSIDLKK